VGEEAIRLYLGVVLICKAIMFEVMAERSNQHSKHFQIVHL